jgi:hypothetical protein
MINHHLGGLQVGGKTVSFRGREAAKDVENILGLNHDELNKAFGHFRA